MTTDEQLAAIRERLAKVTPGDKFVVQIDRECGEYSPQYYVLAIGPYENDDADCFAFSHEICDRSEGADGINADFELFAHAPADIDLLLALLADAERERDEAADARQAEIVAKLRADADAGDRNLAGLNRAMYPSTDAMIAAFRTAADAIERGEFREQK